MTDRVNTPQYGVMHIIIRRIALGAVLLIFFTGLALWAWVTSYMNQGGPLSANTNIIVTIEKGSSVREIRKVLADSSAIHHDIRFLILAKLSGHGVHLQAGEFLLRGGMKPIQVLETLATAMSIQYSVTIPEGMRADIIGKTFSERGWCSIEEFTKLLSDKDFIAGLGLSGVTHLEGYLYPDTYLFTKETGGAQKIVTMMVKRFLHVWDELTGNQPVNTKPKKKFSRHELVILASMVERETSAKHERPRIAGVFYNRLSRGMRLQSDPTVMYGLQKFSNRLTKKDLRTHTPYNTYTIPALPVGPICSPGKEALYAVMHPEKTEKLYFVSKNNGTHIFSSTLRDHINAVNKYQRKKKKKQGK